MALCILAEARAQSDSLLLRMIAGKDSLVDHVLRNAPKYHLQILLSVEGHGAPPGRLTHSQLNRDRYYFYPASLIKFPLAIKALEQMSVLETTHGITPDDRLGFSLCSCDPQTSNYVSKLTPPTFRQALREMMVMSNNSAYNLLFDMVGIDSLNLRMRELGYISTLMKRRFVSPCDNQLQRRHGGIRFHGADGMLKHMIPCSESTGEWEFAEDWPHQAGTRHLENGKWVAGPKSYRGGNHVSLAEAHDLLIRLMRPDLYGADTLTMNSALRKALVDAMGAFPRELESPQYPKGKFPDHYYKFFLDPATMDTRNGHLRIYNKVGLADGFVSDVSYVVDEERGLRFFLSASMLASRPGEPGGYRHNYYDLGIPFLRRVGSLVYRHLSEEPSPARQPRTLPPGATGSVESLQTRTPTSKGE